MSSIISLPESHEPPVEANHVPGHRLTSVEQESTQGLFQQLNVTHPILSVIF